MCRGLWRTSQLNVSSLLPRTTIDEVEQRLATRKRLEECLESIRMIDHAGIVQSLRESGFVGINVDHDFDFPRIRDEVVRTKMVLDLVM